ncbi:MAG: ADP-forming succinate--CoA ligase subunit beta [Deltaproteobacteria bacterium]|nr:ADP-forming succinate--CoA ligase subunit beta [Deltaproteobacteria bacterium]
MKIHEFQAKEVLRKHGVPTLQGAAAHTPEQAVAGAQSIGGSVWVVKSQVHAGGRGKGRFVGEVDEDAIQKAARGDDAPGKGGVRVCKDLDAVRAAAQAMLGNTLVTKQTGRDGAVVRKLYIEQGCQIAKEFYLAIMLDRARGQVLVMCSAEGGTEIEEVAAHRPEAILKAWADPLTGLGAWQARDLAFGLGFTGKAVNNFVKLVQGLFRAYNAADCSMLEVNPLILTADEQVLPLDAKITFDDNALFRHPEYESYYDASEEDPQEVEAAKYELSYVKLDGNIGCMVNGAGLAMATMDIIKFYGEEPANFLDVGGGATREKVTAAFKIITADSAVKGILVNIFGGIMKCDVIAEGVLAAVRETGLEVPLVVRLEGTNVDLGKKIIAESGLRVIAADSMSDAAEKIVAAVRGV